MAMKFPPINRLALFLFQLTRWEKTINNMMGKASGFDFVNMNNMGNFSNKNSKDSGYLLCDSCPVYYKLDHPLGPEDPKECGCGGKLIFSSKPRYND